MKVRFEIEYDIDQRAVQYYKNESSILTLIDELYNNMMVALEVSKGSLHCIETTPTIKVKLEE